MLSDIGKQPVLQKKSLASVFYSVFETTITDQTAICHSLSLYYRIKFGFNNQPAQVSIHLDRINERLNGLLIPMINHDIDLIHALKDRLGASLTQFENITKSLEKMKQDLSTIKWEFESVQTPSKKPSLKIDYRDSSGRSVLNQTLMLRDRSCTQPLFDKYGVDSTFDASTRRYQEIDNCDIDHYDAISVINARVKVLLI